MNREIPSNVLPLTKNERELAKKFKKIFSASGFNPYKHQPSIKDMGCFPYVDSVEEFISTLAQKKIGVSAKIDDPSVRFYNNPELIPTASAIELRKMLYAMTRGERFCGGVFGEAISKGIISAALEKILTEETIET